MNDSRQPLSLPADHPFAQRRTVQTLQNQEGQIVKLDSVNFGIQSATDNRMLLPLNLPVEFQKEGENVLFSGSVKEVGLNELFAGQPLVLIQLKKP